MCRLWLFPPLFLPRDHRTTVDNLAIVRLATPAWRPSHRISRAESALDGYKVTLFANGQPRPRASATATYPPTCLRLIVSMLWPARFPSEVFQFFLLSVLFQWFDSVAFRGAWYIYADCGVVE